MRFGLPQPVGRGADLFSDGVQLSDIRPHYTHQPMSIEQFNSQYPVRTLAQREATADYFERRERAQTVEVLVMSRCHEHEGEWDPLKEREPLAETIDRFGFMPPEFKFTPDEIDGIRERIERYKQTKAAPAPVNVKKGKPKRVRVVERKLPTAKIMTFHKAAEELGVMLSYVAQMVKSGNVQGSYAAKTVHMGSLIAYMETKGKVLVRVDR